MRSAWRVRSALPCDSVAVATPADIEQYGRFVAPFCLTALLRVTDPPPTAWRGVSRFGDACGAVGHSKFDLQGDGKPAGLPYQSEQCQVAHNGPRRILIYAPDGTVRLCRHILSLFWQGGWQTGITSLCVKTFCVD